MTKEEMEKRMKRKRKSKETIRFDGKEHTLSEVFANHCLTGRYLRRIEGYLKMMEKYLNRERNIMAYAKEKGHAENLAYLKKEWGGHPATVEGFRGIVAQVRAYYLNGSKPVKPARA